MAKLRLNECLEDDRSYLCGDRFTVADVCVGFALFNASRHGLLGGGLIAAGRELCERYKPQTKAYLERLMAHPARVARRAEEQEVEVVGVGESYVSDVVTSPRPRVSPLSTSRDRH